LPTSEPSFLRELTALCQLVELEQLGNEWHFAAPVHLMEELLSGKPTVRQRHIYSTLLEAWNDSGWQEIIEAGEETVISIESRLESLKLRDDADKRHLA
jgi:CTP:molybdopterin cytidylyltransferase MocA